MFYDLVDIWNETVDDLGGLRGLFFLMAGMFVFVQIVNWTIGRRRVRKTFQRMNAERLRKTKGL